MRVLSVLAVNTEVARAIIRKPHLALWPKRLDTSALDGSISLKFLRETRLQSESFDALEDLLGFQVQKL